MIVIGIPFFNRRLTSRRRMIATRILMGYFLSETLLMTVPDLGAQVWIPRRETPERHAPDFGEMVAKSIVLWVGIESKMPREHTGDLCCIKQSIRISGSSEERRKFGSALTAKGAGARIVPTSNHHEWNRKVTWGTLIRNRFPRHRPGWIPFFIPSLFMDSALTNCTVLK